MKNENLPSDYGPDEELGERFDIDQIEAKPLRHKNATIIAVTAAAIALTGAGVLGNYLNTDNEATADLNASTNEVSVKKVVWDQHHALDPATLYFAMEATNSDMQYKLHIKPLFGHGPELPINPRVNKLMSGDGAEHFSVPFKGIDQTINPVTDKIDFTVDMTKVKAEINWIGAYPNIKNFTYSGDKKNFGDRSGFRKQLIDKVSSDAKFVNIDGLSNKVDNIDKKVEHDMKQRGIDAFKQCNDNSKFNHHLESAISESIENNVHWLQHGDDLGTVDFEGKLAAKNIDTGQHGKELLGDKAVSDYDLKSGKYHLDKLNCNPPHGDQTAQESK